MRLVFFLSVEALAQLRSKAAPYGCTAPTGVFRHIVIVPLSSLTRYHVKIKVTL